MWINVGKQVINLDQVARIELAKSYLYLYGKDPGGPRSGAENGAMLASIRCNSESEAQERYDALVKLIGAIDA
jgi:hypothetical protein